MAAPPQMLLEKLGDAAVFASIVSAVVGGAIAQFRPWLISQDQCRCRVDLLRQRLFEQCVGWLDRAFREVPSGLLEREDLPTSRDILTAYTTQVFRTITVVLALDRLYDCMKRLYTCLLVSVALGGAGALIAYIDVRARPFVGFFAIGLLLLQFIGVLVIRRLADALDHYERTQV